MFHTLIELLVTESKYGLLFRSKSGIIKNEESSTYSKLNYGKLKEFFNPEDPSTSLFYFWKISNSIAIIGS